MRDRILQIAARELGTKDNIFAATKMSDVFSDSLEWINFIQCVREEVGPLSDDAAVKAETFEELASCYAVSN
jgi:hypothetical protein